jgi:hypothetical protein
MLQFGDRSIANASQLICPASGFRRPYEPVDWVAPRPKPLKPPTRMPSRKSLQARLKKLDAETKQLREQLKGA